ncbi:uncharacterized protein LOC141902406 [Tubulanus polymorphus]|uniref:uncharacterized protein LOC141902406 n=1 Tax=Tubulanus polymorphus TaxID=672921 RepID=UPI003DA53B86
MATKSSIFERAKLVLSTIFKPDETNDQIKEVSDNVKTSTKDSNSTQCNSITTGPRSKEQFFDRVSTFTNVTWFAKPLHLAPLTCARYGWQNVDRDLLKCVSCKVFLSGQLPHITDITHHKKAVKNLEDLIINRHHEHCSWRFNPCPESYLEIDFTDKNVCINEYHERLNNLIKLGLKLPLADLFKSLSPCDLEKLADCVPKQSVVELPDDLHVRSAIINTACKIALCGWNPSSDTTLVCSFCRRKIGTWNLTLLKESTLDHSLTEEQEQEQEQEGQSEPSSKKRKIESNSERPQNAFQPLSQHKPWCSWSTYIPRNSAVDCTTEDSSSSLSSSPAKHNIPAWNKLLHLLAPSTRPGYQRPSQRILGDDKMTPPHEGLRNVRRILNALSSPDKPSGTPADKVDKHADKPTDKTVKQSLPLSSE